VVLAVALATGLMVAPAAIRADRPAGPEASGESNEDQVVEAAAGAPSRWTSVSAVRGGGLLRIVGARSSAALGVLGGTPSGGFSAMRVIGRSMAGGAAVLYASGRYTVVAVGSDHRLRLRTGSGGTWTDWRVLGSGLYTGTPAAVRVSANTLVIVANGADHRLYQVTVRNRRSAPRTSIGGSRVAGTPAVVYQARAGRLTVFWTSSDGALHRRVKAKGSWGSTTTVAGGYRPGVGAVITPSGSLRVVTVGTDRHLVVRAGDAGGWSSVTDLGGSVTGAPAVTWDGARKQFDVIAAGTDGSLVRRYVRGGHWSGWTVVDRPAGLVSTTAVDILLARWGGSLTGLPGVLSDLRTTKAGRTIVSSCGTRVRLDPRLLDLLVAVTDRYHVMVNNMVTGHGCDAAQHPKGRAIDFNIAIDPRTGARTNFHSGGSGDNDTLDRQFVSLLASKMPAGSGLGQRYCGSRGQVKVGSKVLFFADTCNHQHAQVATS
jgi:hypothetical protein